MAETTAPADKAGVTPKPAVKDIVAKGATILMVAMFLSRIVGFAREKLIAHHFGAKWWTDAFFTAFETPDLMYYLLAGGALGAALIPVLREHLHRDDQAGGHRVANSFMNLILLATSAMIFIAVFAAPLLVRYVVAPGYTGAKYDLTVSLTRILLPQVALMVVSAILTALLQCHDHFTWPAVGWVLYNFGIIFGIVVLAPLIGGPLQRQIYGVMFGVLLGAVLLISLQIPALRRVGYRWQPIAELSNPAVRGLLRTWFPIVCSLAISQIMLLSLPKWLGSYFGDGMVTNIRFAQRLILLPFSIFGVSIATAAFPTMSTQALAGRLEEVRQTFSRAMSSTLFFILPSSVGLIVLSLPVTRLLWKSGEYSELAVRTNAQLLSLFSLGLVALCALQIINRAFFAFKEVRIPLFVGVGVFLINLGLCYTFMHSPLQFKGIPLATSISFCIYAVIVFELLRRKLKGVDGGNLVGSFLRSLVATILMALAVLLTCSLVTRLPLNGTGLGISALQVLAGIGVAVPVYLGTAILLKVPEAYRTWERLTRKLRRQSARA